MLDQDGDGQVTAEELQEGFHGCLSDPHKIINRVTNGAYKSVSFEQFEDWAAESRKLNQLLDTYGRMTDAEQHFEFQCTDSPSSFASAFGRPLIHTKFNCNAEKLDASQPCLNCTDCEALLLDHLFEDVYPEGAYSHELFMSEIDMIEWNLIPHIKMIPVQDEFDFSSAMAKKQDWFERYRPETIAAVVDACSKVNRWNFVKVMYSSGLDWMTTSLTSALLFLCMLYETIDLTKPSLKMMDAGCGTGYMLCHQF